MSEQDTFDGEGMYLPAFTPQKEGGPKTLAEVREEMELDNPIVAAKDLVDTSFIIRAAKAWESSLGKGGTVYYCTCASVPDGEVFDVNLGGQAVVELLSKVFAGGLDEPLQVTLRQKSGGKYGRYYVLE